jgi:hypothetical protein
LFRGGAVILFVVCITDYHTFCKVTTTPSVILSINSRLTYKTLPTVVTDAVMEELAHKRGTTVDEAIEWFLKNKRPYIEVQ